MQKNSPIEASVIMTDKLAKYKESLKGSNVSAIRTVLKPQLKLITFCCVTMKN